MKKTFKIIDKINNKTEVVTYNERNLLHFQIQRTYRMSFTKNKKAYTRKTKYKPIYD
jgi:hypothetical protein